MRKRVVVALLEDALRRLQVLLGSSIGVGDRLESLLDETEFNLGLVAPDPQLRERWIEPLDQLHRRPQIAWIVCLINWTALLELSLRRFSLRELILSIADLQELETLQLAKVGRFIARDDTLFLGEVGAQLSAEFRLELIEILERLTYFVAAHFPVDVVIRPDHGVDRAL